MAFTRGTGVTAPRSAAGSDAYAAWREKVDECTAKCNGDRQRGFKMAAREFPELREACLAESPGH